MADCIGYMAGGVLANQVMDYLRLPLSTPSTSFKSGLSSALSTSEAAFLASTSMKYPVIFCLTHGPEANALGDHETARSYSDWKAKVDHSDDPDLSSVLSRHV